MGWIETRDSRLREYLVLAQQERQEHQHSSIMDDPPDIDVSLSEALAIGRICSDVLWHQKSQVSSRGLPHNLYKREKSQHTNGFCKI